MEEELALVDALTRTPLVLLVAFCVGRLFALLRLPKISGYLFTGVVCGPQGLGMLSMLARRRLWPVDNLCLALIGIAAGSELSFAELRRREFRTSVLWLTASVTLCTWLFVFPVILLLSQQIGFLRDAAPSRKLAVASLAATLGVARSPASMIAVLREMEGRGPFCSLVMSVTVVKDVLVLLLFSINLEFVAASEEFAAAAASAGAVGAASAPASRLAFAVATAPIAKIAASMVAGAAGGVALGLTLHPRLWGWTRRALVLGLAAGLYLGSGRVSAEPLLVCVVAGALAGNRKEERGERQREELHRLLAGLQEGVTLAFFTLAGCALAVNLLAATAPVAVAIHLSRLASLAAGCSLGGRTLPRDFQRVCWMAMVTQAGVALGLARSVMARFPGWGGDFYTLMVATIVLNQAVGPPLFRAAIVAVGESHRGKGGGAESLLGLPDSSVAAERDR